MFSVEGHIQNLEMMEGEFYDKDTLGLIENPLISAIATLQHQMKNKSMAACVEYENLVTKMIHDMKTYRKHTHSTHPPRLTKRSEALRRRPKK
jgi:hypothetical protein